MASRALNNYGKSATVPQTQKAVKGQKKNNAGGYVFKITPMQRLVRFCTMGADGGTYYVNEDKLTEGNAKNIIKHAKTDGLDFVNEIVNISIEGRAKKNTYAIFALALLAKHGTPEVKSAVSDNLASVCRTPTMLVEFLEFAKNIGLNTGSSVMKRGLRKWYDSKTCESLEYLYCKYPHRNGWTQRDLLRVVHPIPKTSRHAELFSVITGKEDGKQFPLITATNELKGYENLKPSKIKSLIEKNNFSWEMLPTALHNDPTIWKILLENDRLPMTALIRQLGRLTRLDLLKPLSPTLKIVLNMLSDKDRIKKSRIHPITVLEAKIAYESGRGKSGATWKPNNQIVDALEDLFYLCYDNVESTGKRTLIGLDVSGSMTYNTCHDRTQLTPAMVGTALSLVILNKEEDSYCHGFRSGFVDLGITGKTRLNDAYRAAYSGGFDGTNCAVPMEWALNNKVEVDTFIVITDNETYNGSQHVYAALEKYREKMGIDSKLIVLACTPTQFSIANPDDPGMLDISGYDSSIVSVISDFSKGLI